MSQVQITSVVDFNPRSHERSDRYQEFHSKNKLPFQSTLPREERHQQPDRLSSGARISIHAPTRGATVYSFNTTSPDNISIHAPTRGATVNGISPVMVKDISIHAPTRGATDACVVITGVGSISIHAPTRGATKHHLPSLCIHGISIHAPTRGATNYGFDYPIYFKFQSTLPREERLQLLLLLSL